MADTSPQNLEDETVGFGRPPRSSRFQKGKSGNPKGRPKNRRRELPYDTVLGQMVTIREDGRERRVTAAEAFLLHLTRKGLAGDSAAARSSLAAIETARAARGGDNSDQIIRVIIISFGLDTILRILGLGIKRHPLDRKKVHWVLHPWLVEAGLARLNGRVLAAEEQRQVWTVTSKPNSVNWPSWWTERS